MLAATRLQRSKGLGVPCARGVVPRRAARSTPPAAAAAARSGAADRHALVQHQQQSAAGQQRPVANAGLVAALVAAALAAGFAFNKMRRQGAVSDYMRDVNTVQMDDLPPELIEAARARRSRERANHRLELEEVELPENHPWATRKPMTKEQEAAIQARLQVRPRRPGPPGGGDSRPRVPRQQHRG